MMINCDIGERGTAHPVDLELMNYIHIANVACGGHAGDHESVRFYKKLAIEKGVRISAHLSYPDKANFGRKELNIDKKTLFQSLNDQLALLEGCSMVKLHGALYNRAAGDESLAESLASWFAAMKISSVLCPPGSALAHACRGKGISVLEEAFAERTYTWDEEKGQLILTPRTEPEAHISTVEGALKQFENIMEKGSVSAHSKNGKENFPLAAETFCIHSDSPIALALAQRLYTHDHSSL